MKKNLDPRALEAVAQIFKVLSEPSRLRILQELYREEKSVTDLSLATGSSQPNVSKHLKLLAEAQLVQKRQEGNIVYYSMKDSLAYQLCDLVCGKIQKRLKKQIRLFEFPPKIRRSKKPPLRSA